MSRARPKIPDYPFTTLVPNLGVATVHERSFVLCDIPGLIEGASTGRGLGHDFLRHIERCGILLHVLDLSNGLETNGALNPAPLIEAYRILRKELSAHSPVLAEKQEVVVLNKCDLTTEDLTPLCTTLAKHGIKIDAQISAAAHGNTENLLKMLLPLVLKEREKREVLLQQESHDLPVLRPHETADRMGAFRIERHNGTLVVLGTRIEQFTRMTDFTSEGACKRFRDVLSRTGIAKAIAREREKEEETYIGDIRVDEYL